jgi:hypothetical protein
MLRHTLGNLHQQQQVGARNRQQPGAGRQAGRQPGSQPASAAAACLEVVPSVRQGLCQAARLLLNAPLVGPVLQQQADGQQQAQQQRAE